MYDILCPYCCAENDICHDYGDGYAEDILHEIECEKCEKNLVFSTYISFRYEPEKENCLNGAEHKLSPTHTLPIEFTKMAMACSDCDYERRMTAEELESFVASKIKKV